jgi:hypothetical protein
MVLDPRALMSRLAVVAAFVSAVVLVHAAPRVADPALGSVRLSRATTADGQPLAAGTYSVRVSDTAVTPVAGQSPDGAVWLEFVQAGTVKGRELATVLVGPAVKQVAKEAPPVSGSSRVEMLAGGQYLRVWINHGGTNYLVHLAVAPK